MELNTSKILFLGPQTNRKHPEKTGGAIVLFEQLIIQCTKNNIDFHIIDTNKKNYSNFILAYFSIIFQLFRYHKHYDVVSLHSTKDYIFFGLFMIFISRFFNINTSLHLFGGDASKVYIESNIFLQKLRHFIFSNIDTLFFELKSLVTFFTKINPNTYWLPNLRTKKIDIQSSRNFNKKFVFISQIREVKGIDQLLEASNLLEDDYVIDIYGPIVDQKYSEDYFKPFKATYKHALKADEVIHVLNQYDVLVLPTFFKGEGYPGIIIEAYSLGLPVIATKLEGIKEITDENITGILIEPKNSNDLALAFQHFSDSNYGAMSDAALHKFDEFDADTQTKRFIERITRHHDSGSLCFQKKRGILTFYETLKYLKIQQIIYRVVYTIKQKIMTILNLHYTISLPSHSFPIALLPSIPSYTIYENQTFTLLNISTHFSDQIDWNYSVNGRLWVYNLNYFDFLQQKSLSTTLGLKLINDFIDQSDSLKDGLEPFPISIRTINWIKFCSFYGLKNSRIDDSLFAQYHILLDNLEYHLLGNHLLENAFSLLFGAYYFQNEKFYISAKKILESELKEQILSDGAHFELSPMYHQIMLFRILDSINLVKNNQWKSQELLPLLEEKASIMLGWLQTISFSDGTIPLLNDSANQIAPTSFDLFNYAKLIGILPIILPLEESGYRKIVKKHYECVIDIGNIGPDYIPGHSHSDTFNFELHIDGKSVIVDTGTSTYEPCQRRNEERCTSAHNTVMINGLEQSDVWGGFRVGKRAKIIEIHNKHPFCATHNGYQSIGSLHERTFVFNENKIVIHDRIKSKNPINSIAYLHFHPDIQPIIENNVIYLNGYCIIQCSGNSKIDIGTYRFAPQFNTLYEAKYVKISFTDQLETSIILDKGLYHQ